MDTYEQTVVAEWSELTLTAIREGSAKPTPTAYQLYVAHTAMYDAWAAYDADAFGHYTKIFRPASESTEANKAEAISYAAYNTLSKLFPDQSETFAAYMDELGYDTTVDTTDTGSAAGVGNAAADGVFAARSGDGSDFENGFADITGYTPVNSPDPDADNAPGGEDFDPNRWQPLRVPNGTVVDENGNPVATDDPASYKDQVVLTPNWSSVTPFALPSGDAVRPDAPPQLGDFDVYVDALGAVTTGDQAYRDQFTAVLETSAELTVEQKVIAEFWADGPRTESPPGHWNQFAQDLSKREGYGVDDDVKLFFALNSAIFDASIATWEAKNHYDYIRPQSAIRDLYFDQEVEAWAGPNLGTQTILGQEWQPYQNTTFVTPPFQEFTSGHSAFSTAAAVVLAKYIGSDQFYDGVSVGNYDLNGDGELDLLGEFIAPELSFEDYDGPPVVLQWDTLGDAADEAGVSRIYGGIHIQDGDLRGRAIGDEVAELSFDKAETLFERGGDLLGGLRVGLYDTDSNSLIQSLNDGDKIDASLLAGGRVAIAAYVADDDPLADIVESVMFDLNHGASMRTENVEPYALFGDIGGDFYSGEGLQLGENTLSLGLYTADQGRGDEIGAASLTFEFVDDNVTFGLYDAATDALITMLEEGAEIARSTVADREVTIAAYVADDSFQFMDAESMRLNMDNGAVKRVENVEPYALFGDRDGDFFGGEIAAGDHTLAYEVYSEDGGAGVLLAHDVFEFTILDDPALM
ncbi:MAG: vanadium-dependent haloperoxidase [Rhodobacteraceae bacterium]|nr:vanadium-dependent haloperoxidase [Paracoccaceae bacterium]